MDTWKNINSQQNNSQNLKELTVKLKSEITEEQLDKLDKFLTDTFNTDEFVVSTEDYVEPKQATWIPLRDLFKVLKEKDMWGMDTKYLNIYLDTRITNGDYHCTIKTRDGKQYLTLEELSNRRFKIT